jgi:regulator of RNase E activity RraB
MERTPFDVPDVRRAARGLALRLLGFLLGAGGGFVMGLGALSTWATVGFRDPNLASLDSTIKGVDVWEGLLALGCGIVVIVLVMATRFMREGASLFATIALLAALGAAVPAGLAVARAEERFADLGTDEAAKRLADQTGLPVEALRERFEQVRGDLVEVRLGVGTPLVILGAGAAVVGSLLTRSLARRGSRGPEPRISFDIDLGGSPEAAAAPSRFEVVTRKETHLEFLTLGPEDDQAVARLREQGFQVDAPTTIRHFFSAKTAEDGARLMDELQRRGYAAAPSPGPTSEELFGDAVPADPGHTHPLAAEIQRSPVDAAADATAAELQALAEMFNAKYRGWGTVIRDD